MAEETKTPSVAATTVSTINGMVSGTLTGGLYSAAVGAVLAAAAVGVAYATGTGVETLNAIGGGVNNLVGGSIGATAGAVTAGAALGATAAGTAGAAVGVAAGAGAGFLKGREPIVQKDKTKEPSKEQVAMAAFAQGIAFKEQVDAVSSAAAISTLQVNAQRISEMQEQRTDWAKRVSKPATVASAVSTATGNPVAGAIINAANAGATVSFEQRLKQDAEKALLFATPPQGRC